MAGLFQLGDYTLSSGRKSAWKIDCDALTDDDMKALAAMAAERLDWFPFSRVVSVPKGKSDSPIDNAQRFAMALWPFCATDELGRVLIVDDVLTSGESMRACNAAVAELSDVESIMGLVIVAREKPPGWIIPLLQLWSPA